MDRIPDCGLRSSPVFIICSPDWLWSGLVRVFFQLHNQTSKHYHWHFAPREQVSAPVDRGRSYQICSDIPSCVCIQPLVDFLRGSKGCNLGFPKQYQPSLGYAHIQSLFLFLSLFRPSFDWDHSWVFTPLSFQLTLWLSLTAPTFNTQIVHYSASCQLPVAGQWWWCCVSGVGGNRHGGVAYHIHYKTKRQCCPSSVCVAWLPHCIQQCGLAWFLWALVIVCWSLPLLCVVVVVVRWLWPFLGQLLSFVGLWQSFVGQLSSFGGRGCLQWWGLHEMAWGWCVEVVVVGGWRMKANITGCDVCFNIVETHTYDLMWWSCPIPFLLKFCSVCSYFTKVVLYYLAMFKANAVAKSSSKPIPLHPCNPGPGILTLIWKCYSYLDLLLHFSYFYPSHTHSHAWTVTTTIPYTHHFPSSILPSRPPESYVWLFSVGLYHEQCNLSPQDRFTRIWLKTLNVGRDCLKHRNIMCS